MEGEPSDDAVRSTFWAGKVIVIVGEGVSTDFGGGLSGFAEHGLFVQREKPSANGKGAFP